MALVNGGAYYLLSNDDYLILSADGDYDQDYLRFFDSVQIDSVTYWYAPHGSFDPNDLTMMMLMDDDGPNPDGVHSVTLSAATYWSGYGFTQTGF